jgi:hypothetical protein
MVLLLARRSWGTEEIQIDPGRGRVREFTYRPKDAVLRGVPEPLPSHVGIEARNDRTVSWYDRRCTDQQRYVCERPL